MNENGAEAISLEAVPALGGADIRIGANHIQERHDLAMVAVATPLGGDAALKKALKAGLGLSMPSATISVVGDDARAVSAAPDQMLLVFAHAAPDAESHVQARLKGAGYTTDQTDSLVAIEISGPDTIAAMERLCPLDLHADSFGTNAAGRTAMEHMAATIICLGAAHFLLLVARSSGQSFLHAIETSYRNVSGEG